MRSIAPIALVIGSDSFVGRALMLYLRGAGYHVLGTTRRHGCIDESHIYLDLWEDVEGWQCPVRIDVAVVCAGVTKIADCRRDPMTSARVNVHGISGLVKNLVGRGTFVIYLSTNQVFDGSVPHRLSNDAVSPVTEYGRQKAEAERRISQWGDSVAIVRLTKILGETVPLFSQWSEALLNGNSIHPFSDMYMAPVPASCAMEVIHLVANRRLSGILQVSGCRDTSYAEAALLGAKLLGVDQSLVKPVPVTKSGSYTEPVPSHTTLNIDRLRSALRIEPPDVMCTIKTAFINSNISGGHAYNCDVNGSIP